MNRLLLVIAILMAPAYTALADTDGSAVIPVHRPSGPVPPLSTGELLDPSWSLMILTLSTAVLVPSAVGYFLFKNRKQSPGLSGKP